jgi:hypothetical protein
MILWIGSGRGSLAATTLSQDHEGTLTVCSRSEVGHKSKRNWHIGGISSMANLERTSSVEEEMRQALRRQWFAGVRPGVLPLLYG